MALATASDRYERVRFPAKLLQTGGTAYGRHLPPRIARLIVSGGWFADGPLPGGRTAEADVHPTAAQTRFSHGSGRRTDGGPSHLELTHTRSRARNLQDPRFSESEDAGEQEFTAGTLARRVDLGVQMVEGAADQLDD